MLKDKYNGAKNVLQIWYLKSFQMCDEHFYCDSLPSICFYLPVDNSGSLGL